MTDNGRHERFTSDNQGVLSHDVWAEDDVRTCRDCGAPLVGAELRCRACGVTAAVCVGACAICISPVCVGGN